MDVFDPNILQRVFLEAILQVGIKKSIGDLGPECPFNRIHLTVRYLLQGVVHVTLYTYTSIAYSILGISVSLQSGILVEYELLVHQIWKSYDPVGNSI